MQRLWQDLRFRARRLMKQLGVLLIAILTLALGAGFTQVMTRTIPLDALNEMQSRNVKTERVTYKGRGALRVTDTAPANVVDGDRLVILSKTEFQDGVIEFRRTFVPRKVRAVVVETGLGCLLIESEFRAVASYSTLKRRRHTFSMD